MNLAITARVFRPSWAFGCSAARATSPVTCGAVPCGALSRELASTHYRLVAPLVVTLPDVPWGTNLPQMSSTAEPQESGVVMQLRVETAQGPLFSLHPEIYSPYLLVTLSFQEPTGPRSLGVLLKL